VGDTVNTCSRLEGLAPAGGILIGGETYGRLPVGAVVERGPGLRMKGKGDAVDAYLLLAIP
jgi:class 3 adenylate cyclase